ncbi:MAG: SCP2 sterol-binding domain-containing protein [Candidatus Hadarchaeales archaeon]
MTKFAFGTQAWNEEYVKRLNSDPVMLEAGKGWGVGWNGDFIFQIDEVPVEKLQKAETMSEAEVKQLAEKAGISLEDAKKIQEEFKRVMKEYLKGKTIYAYVGLKDGKCTGMRLLKDPNEVQVGFKLAGPYDSWKKLAKAETDATKLVLTGKMKLQGDMSKVMRYIKATQQMGKVSSQVPTIFVDEYV